MCRTKNYGSLYVQWGKRSCTGTSTIYTHYAAAPHYTHSGGGVNQLCMHPSPRYLNSNTADRGGVSAR